MPTGAMGYTPPKAIAVRYFILVSSSCSKFILAIAKYIGV